MAAFLNQVTDTSSVWRWACSGRARSNGKSKKQRLFCRRGDTLEAEAEVVGGGYVEVARAAHS